eukprot:6223932-Amphidinium_carterae.2
MTSPLVNLLLRKHPAKSDSTQTPKVSGSGCCTKCVTTLGHVRRCTAPTSSSQSWPGWMAPSCGV